MKAERRHDLKTNALAAKLFTLPDAWRKFVKRLITGLLLVVAAIVGGFAWHSYTVEKKQRLIEDLASAYDRIDELQGFPNSRFNSNCAEVENALTEIDNESSDPKLRAQALVARGDLYSTLARSYWLRDNQPVQSEADKDFELQPSHSRTQLIISAVNTYKSVEQRYPKQVAAVIQAHFGLAAIDEDLAANPANDSVSSGAHWQTAQGHFVEIAQLAGNTPDYQFYKRRAFDQFQSARQLAMPILLGTPKEPIPDTTQSSTTQSSTTPSATMSSATSPAILPAMPATRRAVPTVQPTASLPTTRP
jgi:hypothetical protein